MSSNVFASNVWYSGNVIVSQTLNGALGTLSATPAAAANVLTVIGSSTTGNVVQFSNSAGGRFVMTSGGNVGLGVSNPVQALEVAGNMIVNGTVSAGNPLMFRNALYNGDMRINQRGISTNWASPTTAIGYTVDRWYASKTSGLAYAQLTTGTSDIPFVNDGIVNYLRVGRTAADTTTGPVYMAQALETRDSYRLCGKSATLSLYYRTGSTFSGGNVLASIIYGTGTDNSPLGFTGTIYQNLNLTATTAWTKASFSAQIPLNATQVGLIYQYTPSSSASSNDYFDITGVQLEKGTVATPFEVRPYATELALCQRYYSNVSTTSGQTLAVATAGNSTCYIAFQVPVTLRSTPAIATTGTLQLRGGGADNTITSFAIAGTSQTLVNIQGTLTSSAGNGVVGALFASTGVSVALNSEL